MFLICVWPCLVTAERRIPITANVCFPIPSSLPLSGHADLSKDSRERGGGLARQEWSELCFV